MELLNIIKTNTTDHLIKSEAEIYQLKELDQIASIEHACQRLALDLKEDLFNTDDYLGYFFVIDDKTRLIVEKLTESYLKIDIINHQYKSRMASAIFLHHRSMFSIYFKLIVALAPYKHPQLTKLIGRAINNAAEVIKWRYFNFQGAPGNVWLQIAGLFDMAEKAGLSNEKMDFYPELENSAFIPNSIAANYIAINMLGSLDSLSFKAQQVDFLCKVLSSWTNELSIDKEYDEHKHLFSVDLEKNLPAKRIRNLKPKLTNRYWCMDSINIKIQVLMNCIETKRSSKQASMKLFANHLYAYQTLQMIRTEWSLSEYKRQRRAHPRIKTDKTATNVYGFEDIYYQIKQYENSVVDVTKKSFLDQDQMAEDADDSASQAAEELKKYAESMTAFININHGFCNIVDESINGLCIHVEKKPHELSVGMMLGIAVKDNRFGTKIGIIRSIRSTENNTLRVGVEIISRNAFSISGYKINQSHEKMPAIITTESVDNDDQVIATVIRTNPKRKSINELISDSPFGNEQEYFNCLFLPKEFSFSKEQSLILPKNQYIREGQYQMMIAKDERLIEVQETIEQHENWIRVYFKEVTRVSNPYDTPV